jgi:hypothetical protein
MWNIHVCEKKCGVLDTCQMLTRNGWVFSPAEPNVACVSKYKKAAVAKCVGVPDVIVRLL